MMFDIETAYRNSGISSKEFEMIKKYCRIEFPTDDMTQATFLPMVKTSQAMTGNAPSCPVGNFQVPEGPVEPKGQRSLRGQTSR